MLQMILRDLCRFMFVYLVFLLGFSTGNIIPEVTFCYFKESQNYFFFKWLRLCFQLKSNKLT